MILFVLKNCAVIPPATRFDVFLKSLWFPDAGYSVKSLNPFLSVTFCCNTHIAGFMAYRVDPDIFFVGFICINTHKINRLMGLVVDELIVNYCYRSVFEQKSEIEFALTKRFFNLH